MQGLPGPMSLGTDSLRGSGAAPCGSAPGTGWSGIFWLGAAPRASGACFPLPSPSLRAQREGESTQEGLGGPTSSGVGVLTWRHLRLGPVQWA